MWACRSRPRRRGPRRRCPPGGPVGVAGAGRPGTRRSPTPGRGPHRPPGRAARPRRSADASPYRRGNAPRRRCPSQPGRAGHRRSDTPPANPWGGSRPPGHGRSSRRSPAWWSGTCSSRVVSSLRDGSDRSWPGPGRAGGGRRAGRRRSARLSPDRSDPGRKDLLTRASAPRPDELADPEPLRDLGRLGPTGPYQGGHGGRGSAHSSPVTTHTSRCTCDPPTMASSRSAANRTHALLVPS